MRSGRKVGRGGDSRRNVQHRGGGLTLSSCGRSAGQREKVGQLVAELAGGTDQGGTVGGIQSRGAGLLMDGIQLSLGAQDHPSGQGEPRGRKNRPVPLRPPLQALGAGAWCHAFESWHDTILPTPSPLARPCSRFPEDRGLTRKALSAIVRARSMKNETKQRLKAALILAAIATAIVIQGLLETNPNH